MTDSRHIKRIELFQDLFAATFTDERLAVSIETYSEETTLGQILRELSEIDTLLAHHAPERPLNTINKVDLAILRVIVFESKHKKTPKKVLVNEAVQLAKEYGSDASSKFVNGVLATVLLDDEHHGDTNENSTSN